MLAALSVGVLAAGCASTSRSAEVGMMDGSGFRYSGLTCAAPSSLPGTVVAVALSDMGGMRMRGGNAPLGAPMTLRATPATAASGRITFVAENRGWRTHELVVMPLGSGASAGQRVPGRGGKVDESASLGEASNSCAAGAGEGITADTVGWVTIKLAPGHYELICNLANHYADGMYQELVVT